MTPTSVWLWTIQYDSDFSMTLDDSVWRRLDSDLTWLPITPDDPDFSMTPDDSVWFRLDLTPNDSGCLRLQTAPEWLRTTLDDSVRFQTTPGDSGWLRSIPADSERLRITLGYLLELVPKLLESDRSQLRIFTNCIHHYYGPCTASIIISGS